MRSFNVSGVGPSCTVVTVLVHMCQYSQSVMTPSSARITGLSGKLNQYNREIYVQKVT
jgi:hypothetical protein